MKSVWKSVPGDSVPRRRVNAWLIFFWIVMIPLAVHRAWLRSVVFVAALCLWALVSGHWSAGRAAREEVEQQQHAQARDEIVELTTVADPIEVSTGISTAAEALTPVDPPADAVGGDRDPYPPPAIDSQARWS